MDLAMHPISSCLLSVLIGTTWQLSTATTASAQTERTVYSFCAQQGCADGRGPYAGLIGAKNRLYGTTNFGGSNNDGTVFSFDPRTDTEKVAYSFCSQEYCSDGENPTDSLVEVNGNLYGTTGIGGTGYYDSCGETCGTVFSVDPDTGAENVLHSFCSQLNCTDGGMPMSGLNAVKGMLYGTTPDGGANTFYSGTVFAINSKSDSESVLYSFCSLQNCEDGSNPNSGVIDVKGTLYGTTYTGGAHDGGTLFSVDPKTGVERVVYSFCSQQNCEDGGYPIAGLIEEKGRLYGTTDTGGMYDYGTVFVADPKSGSEMVIYSFCSQENCADGAYPEAGLIDVKGILYGTTYRGGAYAAGTVYALDPRAGTEKVLYAFCARQNCTDGEYPGFGSLIDLNGTLYGTTLDGGDAAGGTIFGIQP